jgi:hypothetical protein
MMRARAIDRIARSKGRCWLLNMTDSSIAKKKIKKHGFPRVALMPAWEREPE